jgi:ribosomal protein L11 methyltransferase
VRPPWSPPRAGALDVVIDPGRAFGTGAHPTTRMCIELMAELAEADEADGPLIDLGTGSGVLAIAAAKLGWCPVQACDHEAASVQAAAENAAANRVEVELFTADLRRELPELAPTVVANLTSPLLGDLAAGIQERRRPRRLVCSGLLEDEAGSIAVAFASVGLRERERRTAGGWAALILGT